MSGFVTALASRLDLAVSIDNGVMHMISLSNTPMIVLFGPTSSEKFAPKNNYTKILNSKELYNSNDINMITVDDVFNEFRNKNFQKSINLSLKLFY